MALGEKRKTVKRQQTISQVSWTDGISLDPYYWLEHSFQYARNINCDDEMHGIKLSQYAERFDDVIDEEDHTNDIILWKCQLVSAWDNWVIALPVGSAASKMRIFDDETFEDGWDIYWWARWWPNRCPWVIFQDYFWHWLWVEAWQDLYAWMNMISMDWMDFHNFIPYDHTDATDDVISNPLTITADHMTWPITAILNYNNTRLVVADGSDIWVYYPELDQANPITHPWNSVPTSDYGKTWWKKTLTFEAWVDIIALTCTFEYLKIRCRDEWWNTKVYYYQGNNNLRDTFVYNVIDLTWQRVVRAYSVNSVDYFVTSTDGSDGYVNLNKMVGNTPIQLLKQRAWLDPLDVNFKAPQFVWPVSLDAPYQSWRFYIADAYWVFSFDYNPQWYDPGYMKWWLNNNKRVYGACINKNFLYVSDEDWCWKIRIYDTWVDWYQPNGILISREYEWLEGWTMTKMLDSIKVNYEMNPLTRYNWTIDVYVSPNNLRKDTHLYKVGNSNIYLPKWTWLPKDMKNYTSSSYDWWYHVMHLWQENIWTRTERMEVLNKLWPDWVPAFGFDWQSITYAIVFNRYTTDWTGTEAERAAKKAAEHATPILRQIDINYHTKDKINNVYDVNTNT